MAGAGYKLFNTGDVLTAAQVNTYLMEQTVMVFANAAARTTALSGVVSEGMISYLKDTNAVEVYDGSNWVSSDDPNAIQNTIVDAKGDLISATAADTPARLAVGNNGETLVADSSASVGLSYRADWAAGKNKVINGDFNINQRGFSSTTSDNTFMFDRWRTFKGGGGTVTYSAQTFTLGSAPVSGYESKNFMQVATSSQSASGDYVIGITLLEGVRTLAGQTATISFWAKATSGTPKIAAELNQNFGSGGSPSSEVNITAGAVTLSTSWARYSITVAVPSISGKTIGSNNNDYLGLYFWFSAGSSFNSRASSIGNQNATFQIWGVQLEAGSVATAFQTATGTLAGELAACQRYYWRFTGPNQYSVYGTGFYTSSTNGYIDLVHPVTMRAASSSVDFANLGTQDMQNALAIRAVTGITLDQAGTGHTRISFTIASGGTDTRGLHLLANNNTAAYIGVSAEL